MAEDEGTKPFPSQNDLTGFTTVENPAPGTKMDVYVTRSLTNLDELLGLRQNFIYPQDLEFVMLADDRKRIKDVFDWATQLSNPSRSIDSTTSDAENNELCQENMPARNDYLQHIASPERNCYTAFSNSEIRQLLDWCCPGWNDMTWKQPCTAPLTKKPLQTAPLGIRQALVCTELLRYFSKEKQKAVLFYWHSGAFIFWLVVHEDVGVMQLPDFDQNHFGLFSNYEFYQDMSETLQGLLNRWNWRTDFFELTFDEKTAKNELTGFGIFEDLKRYYLPLGSKFEDIVLEIFTTLLSTRVVPTFSVKPYSNSQIKRGTEKYNRQENRLKLKEQDPSVKMNDLFPDWSKLEAITCYVYPPVYVPHYQGPTTKRMEDYKTWKTNLQARNEINPVPRYTKYLGPTKTQTKKNKAKEANAEAQNDEGKAEQTQLEHYEVQARGASGEYHAFDALKRAFARLKEKAFIVLHWKFENYNKELHKLPDVDILVIHASRGPALFEVKTIQSYDEMSNQAKRKKLDDISRTGCLKSNELRDAFQTCFLIEGQYKYITSFICFPLLKFPSEFYTGMGISSFAG
ncbi:uncharacterized protein LOC129601492 isoform X1 [Paramacrobiotus metropolitanus]|uniref:uncharacterized protein LOC129601492 isoform X1 n=1 Tax=Paramacrobiotus metropolitanus TaxID=2943436 RepID=UPI00244599FE|nr:uncharacterized protein LOC129601492 isoform X1 [Paramacrobiotus metropolitanus]XP_055356296.1 uncharacterized protein LOC129601492 isoform X1 [Paramacrobiotus metropolitanus]XP_055356297.1 uncharacterized protein LOC129601492 isoform X1 [Paramacrobiotus metropolitanus]